MLQFFLAKFGYADWIFELLIRFVLYQVTTAMVTFCTVRDTSSTRLGMPFDDVIMILGACYGVAMVKLEDIIIDLGGQHVFQNRQHNHTTKI